MDDFFFVKDGENYIQIFFSAILYIQAANKYSTLVTSTKRLLMSQPLSAIERALPAKLFCRVHRSYIISIPHTTSFNNTTVTIAGKIIPIGKNYRAALHKRVMIFDNGQKDFIKLSDFDMHVFFKNVRPN